MRHTITTAEAQAIQRARSKHLTKCTHCSQQADLRKGSLSHDCPVERALNAMELKGGTA